MEKRETKKSLGVFVLERALVTASESETHASGTFNGDVGSTSLLSCVGCWVEWALASENLSKNVCLYVGHMRA